MLKPMSREDALLLFRKLEDDNSLVLLFTDLFGWRVVLRGKVRLFNAAEISLAGADGAELSLRLDAEDTLFWYAEPREMPFPQPELVPDIDQDSACICVEMPLRVLPKDFGSFEESPPGTPWFRERLLFLELRDGVR